MSILDAVLGQLGGGQLGQLSQRIGADEQQTHGAVRAALPLLLSGLAQRSRTPEGERHLAEQLEAGQGQGLLQQAFGGRQEVIEQTVSRSSGLEAGKVARLLPLLAPLVMNILNQQRRSGGGAGGGLGSLLDAEQGRLEQQHPGTQSALTRLLDSNGDGSVLDDVAGMLGRFRR
ncbi:hypothetical protein HNR42_002444 [Deinobacterium chartae]|uniref:DUF937 domain-containing protein n=1 Tax=Deinobacterium chartae TaxID=521158 RepID=A0A841I3R0_9DEIO|nr:DUF937 domain-containing protein [Deinobacterium chartae]MBB6099008.1 hypothetical protein [Deinobacterium chartae]